MYTFAFRVRLGTAELTDGKASIVTAIVSIREEAIKALTIFLDKFILFPSPYIYKK
jgi:hypothetical protein